MIRPAKDMSTTDREFIILTGYEFAQLHLAPNQPVLLNEALIDWWGLVHLRNQIEVDAINLFELFDDEARADYLKYLADLNKVRARILTKLLAEKVNTMSELGCIKHYIKLALVDRAIQVFREQQHSAGRKIDTFVES